MPIHVRELRLSFVWFEPFSDKAKPTSSIAFFKNPLAYEKAFSVAMAGAGAWKLPWNNLFGRHFWEYYLGKTALDQVSADKAWKHVVPLCPISMAKGTKPPHPYFRVAVEGYFYPHGVGASVTVVLRANMPLEAAVERAIETRHTQPFNVTWPNKISEELSLDNLGSRALDNLWKAAQGDLAKREKPLAEPFSIVTAIDGTVPDPGAVNPVDGEIHRALEGLCRFHPLWKINSLHPLDDTTCIRFKDRGFMPKGHLLYSLERSRAVWFPGYFSQGQSERIRKLGCYHNNLTLASLQTESLADLMHKASGLIMYHRAMPADYEKLVRNAAGVLGRLYGGIQEKTYRSWSPRRQMEDNHHVTAIDEVRDFFGMGKLSP